MKKYLSSLLIGGFIGVIFFTTSCTKDYVISPPPPDPTDTIFYSLDIQPFFNANCITGCHDNIPPRLEDPGSYDNLIQGGYINLTSPEQSLLYTKINAGGSMAAYASATERQEVLLWIKQGALKN